MRWEVALWLVLALVCLVLATREQWRPWLPRVVRVLRAVPWGWYLAGFPATACRMWATWRKVCQLADLTVTYRPRQTVLGALVVRGEALRPIPPRLGVPWPTRSGLRVRVRLHPGQTPAVYAAAAEALTHAWHVHAVRVGSPARGVVELVVIASDPLADSTDSVFPSSVRLLAARLGRVEDGGAWEVDFRRVPHWLIVGATRSGKSTLLAALVGELAPQPVALVGIDCKGGMELSLFGPRLSALATNRTEAARLLAALVVETESRMVVCRAAGARSVWELPESGRPVPVVVLVDEIAELYLTDGSRDGKQAAVECSTALVRLAQLGAALGVHLVVAGQRVGSELGPGVTALRAQLGGRICHRVNDDATADMALGDLAPDAVTAALAITEDEQGVAVTTIGGRWVRARSTLTTTGQARQTARAHAGMAPVLPALAGCVESTAGGGRG